MRKVKAELRKPGCLANAQPKQFMILLLYSAKKTIDTVQHTEESNEFCL